MKRIAMFCVALFAAIGAFADLSTQWEEWGRGPAQHLMTSAEKEEWASIREDAQAERFVALFWARRDPTPATAQNEHRDLFESRVEFAKQNFRTPKLSGPMSARGRVFILLGSPYSVARNTGGPTSTLQSGLVGDIANSNARGQAVPTEMWVYEKERVPPFSPMKEFEIAFTDQYGTDDWELSRTPRTNVKHLLDLAVESMIVSPELAEIPVYAETAAPQTAVTVRTAFTSAVLQKAINDFRGSQDPAKGAVHLTWDESVTAEGEGFIPIQLYVPASARVAIEGADTLFVSIVDGEGTPVRAYEQPADLVESNGDLFADVSAFIEPGDYVAIAGLARGEQPLVMARAAVSVKGIDAAASSTSQLILSNRIYPMSEAQEVTEPFAFGGLKVVPKGDRTFRKADELWYFLELRNPGVDDSGVPSLQVKLEVEGKAGDKPVKMAAPPMKAEVQPVKDVPGHFATGSSIPLASFAAGEYAIRVRLFDSILKKTYEFEEHFRIVE